MGTQHLHTAVCLYGEATALDGAFWIAPRAIRVRAITCRPLVVGSDGGAVTAVVKKAPSGTASASGTSLHASGTFDLKGTIDTNQSADVVTTDARLLAAGDALCLDVTGTTTAARGIIVVAYELA
jgi:hypothetical protein